MFSLPAGPELKSDCYWLLQQAITGAWQEYVLTGTVEIAGNIKGAKLYAADLSEVKAIPVTAGKAVVELQDLKRFFSVIVEK